VEGQTRIHADRLILGKRCAYFAKMFTSGMRESNEKEIGISDTSADVFKLVLAYLYTGSLIMEVEYAPELFRAADLYGLEKLQGICCDQVIMRLTAKSVCSVLQKSSDFQCGPLKTICLEFVLNNFKEVSSNSQNLVDVLSKELLKEIIEKHGASL
jgi:hypothetical protein